MAYYSLCQCPESNGECTWFQTGNPEAVSLALGINPLVAMDFQTLGPPGLAGLTWEGTIKCGNEGDQKPCNAKEWGKFTHKCAIS